MPTSALQRNSASALVYTAQAIGGSGWAKAMAFALALSVIATTGTGIVLSARIIYGMASRRVLPALLGNVSARFATPVAASVLVGFLAARPDPGPRHRDHRDHPGRHRRHRRHPP